MKRRQFLKTAAMGVVAVAVPAAVVKASVSRRKFECTVPRGFNTTSVTKGVVPTTANTVHEFVMWGESVPAMVKRQQAEFDQLTFEMLHKTLR